MSSDHSSEPDVRGEPPNDHTADQAHEDSDKMAHRVSWDCLPALAAAVEEAVDTQAAANAEADATTNAEAEAADAAASAVEEPEPADEPSSETQAPTQSSEVPRVSAEELKERLDNGENIVIVDTRWKDPYDLEHIAGAILPAESPLDEFPHDQELVIYCT